MGLRLRILTHDISLENKCKTAKKSTKNIQGRAVQNTPYYVLQISIAQTATTTS